MLEDPFVDFRPATKVVVLPVGTGQLSAAVFNGVVFLLFVQIGVWTWYLLSSIHHAYRMHKALENDRASAIDVPTAILSNEIKSLGANYVSALVRRFSSREKKSLPILKLRGQMDIRRDGEGRWEGRYQSEVHTSIKRIPHTQQFTTDSLTRVLAERVCQLELPPANDMEWSDPLSTLCNEEWAALICQTNRADLSQAILKDRHGALREVLLWPDKKIKPHEIVEVYTDQDELCIICVTKKRNVIFWPCRHLIICSDCSSRMTSQKCPQCRDVFKDWFTITSTT